MAFCPKCGSPMFDGAQYCMSCGGNINPLGAGGASAFRMFMLKNHTLIRVALTATCVSFVLTFLVNTLQSGLFLGLILSALPGLMAGALLFIASQEGKVGPFPSTGFTVIKVCTIISLVLASLAAAVMFLYGAVLNSSKDMADMVLEEAYKLNPDSEAGVEYLKEVLGIHSAEELLGFLAGVMLAIGAVLVAVVFLYYVPLLRTCTSVKWFVLANVPAKISVLLPISLWISAGISLLGMAFIVPGIFNILSLVASITSDVCFALLLQNASKELSQNPAQDQSLDFTC